MNEKIEERRILDANVWCVTARTPSGAKVRVCGKTREEALEKARWAEPDPA